MSEETENTEESGEPITEETKTDAGVTEESPAQEVVSEVAVELQPEVEEEVNELSLPSVIDLKALLKPISDELPSGESLRYSGVYDEINEARREDDVLAIGDASGLKTADFKKVIEISTASIEKRSKDMQISAWLTEALIKEHGFLGLRDGLNLMGGLVLNFWDSVYPEIDEGDMEGRANAIAWIDREGAFAAKYAPITIAGYGLEGLEDSKRFDIPENLDGLASEEKTRFEALKKQAEAENRTTAAEWNKALAQSRRDYYEKLDVTIEECKEAIGKLDQAIEEKFDRNQAPGLNTLKNQLSTIQRETNKILELRRTEEPDAADEEDALDGTGTRKGEKGTQSSTGAIQNRRDALKRLSDLSSFFKRTEPHSPISYLVNRAVKWGNMPLESWLQDVIKDPNILEQLRQTLGFNTEGSAPQDTIAGAAPHPSAVPETPEETPFDEGGSEPMQ